MIAVFLAQTLFPVITDDTVELDLRRWLYDNYGDGVKSLWTIFEATFSGCWPYYFRRLVMEVNWLFAPVLVVYVTAVVFSMTRIVAALFLKETLSQASEDTEMMVKERQKSAGQLERSLAALFLHADESGDGLLTEEEFCRFMAQDKIKLLMAKVGVDAADARNLFNQLGNLSTGQLDSKAFAYGIKRLKGEARAQDLIPVVHDCNR